MMVTKGKTMLGRELHALLLNRIYHEDLLLSQRTYNFFTFNVFLAAGFILFVVQDRFLFFSYVVALFGLAFAFLQVFLARRTRTALLFWREYARLVEKKLPLKFDSALFAFYETASAEVHGGNITARGTRNNPMNRTPPWNIPFLSSTNAIVGEVFPWLVSLFWVFFIVGLLYQSGLVWAVAPCVLIYLGLFTGTNWIWIPATPKAQMDV